MFIYGLMFAVLQPCQCWFLYEMKSMVEKIRNNHQKMFKNHLLANLLLETFIEKKGSASIFVISQKVKNNSN